MQSGIDTIRTNLQDETVEITGGRVPTVTTMNDFSAAKFSDWIESVEKKPAELQSSFKLFPYYSLAGGEQATSLRDATIAYLNGTMLQHLPVTRDNQSRIMAEETMSQKKPLDWQWIADGVTAAAGVIGMGFIALLAILLKK